MRIGAVLVPLSTLLRPPELARAARGAAASRTSSSSASTAAARYLDDLDVDRARRSPTLGAARRATRGCRRCADVWLADELPDGRGARRRWSTALEARGAPGRRPRRPVHLGQPRRAEGRDPHPRQRAPGRPPPGSTARCVGAGERLYIPMPFFWTGGFGGGLLTVLVAGATLLTEAEPEPGAHARASSSASGRRCSAAGPTRRRASRPHPALRRRRPVVAAARAASPRCCRPSGGPRPARGRTSSA